MKKKGFTLIELIAVIAILAILAIIAVPRVMAYVEKSKKVAIQTEATTIYNAAEAAYNDGKFTAGKDTGVGLKKEHFDGIMVKDVAKFLKDDQKDDQGLLSNVYMDKNVNMYRFENFPNMTLKNLESIVNTKPEDLSISSDGKLTGSFDSNGEYTKHIKEK